MAKKTKEEMIDWMKAHHYMTVTTKRELMGCRWIIIKRLYDKAKIMESR